MVHYLRFNEDVRFCDGLRRTLFAAFTLTLCDLFPRSCLQVHWPQRDGPLHVASIADRYPSQPPTPAAVHSPFPTYVSPHSVMDIPTGPIRGTYEDGLLWMDTRGHWHVFFHVYTMTCDTPLCDPTAISGHSFSAYLPDKPLTTTTPNTHSPLTRRQSHPARPHRPRRPPLVPLANAALLYDRQRHRRKCDPDVHA